MSDGWRRRLPVVVMLISVLEAGCTTHPDPHDWSIEEIAVLRSLWIESLPVLPNDPGNRYADDPRAARLGHALFFDTGLSVNGKVACASCHKPELFFTDGLPLARALGTTRRGTPTIVGTAYSPWQFWDGRRDSQWSQALVPLEHFAEHGGNRMQLVRYLADHYAAEYESVFGPLPEISDRSKYPESASPGGRGAVGQAWSAMTVEDRRVVSAMFANLGKAIAAYERLLIAGPGRFDAYVGAVVAGDRPSMQEIFTPAEANGARLFIGKAQCVNCHNGPLLTNNAFHNTGLPGRTGESFDDGRKSGVVEALNDEFRCPGPFSDVENPYRQCLELLFAKIDTPDLEGAFKTPTLRNVAETAPYMHTGQFRTLAEVLDHYNRAPDAERGHNEAKALQLTSAELGDLEAFLSTLTGPLAVPPELLNGPRAD